MSYENKLFFNKNRGFSENLLNKILFHEYTVSFPGGGGV
jgi:hypothetical protein